jgi:hypothetical protein
VNVAYMMLQNHDERLCSSLRWLTDAASEDLHRLRQQFHGATGLVKKKVLNFIMPRSIDFALNSKPTSCTKRPSIGTKVDVGLKTVSSDLSILCSNVDPIFCRDLEVGVKRPTAGFR